MTNGSKFYQCPYDKAIQCLMTYPCAECEDFKPEELKSSGKKNARSPYDLSRAGFQEYK